MAGLAGLGLVGALLAACEKKPPPEILPAGLVLGAVSFDELPGWGEDAVSEALPALARSCRRLEGRPDDRAIGPKVDSAEEAVGGKVADWRAPCAALAQVPPGDDGAARAFFETWFAPLEAASTKGGKGTFTGYYEAELRGAPFPGEAYAAPIYARPPDLVTVDLRRFRADLPGERLVGRVEDGRLVPYHTRAQIDAGALAGRGAELLWADDPVDVFFLQVQGSGRVMLPDGTVQRIGFAESNGHPFTGIGRLLLAEGKIPRDQASMQGIRDWLRAHPDEARAFMQRNARFIFFRQVDGEGPIGAQGVALTPGRSLAVDPAFLPLGAPIFLATTWPGGKRPLRRLMVAQDTGSAIKGPLRGDFFWGFGEAALKYAGRMKQEGVIYLLLPKALAARRAGTS
jgi:membrane-bound lytic murein transglycosylase A